MPQLCLSCSNPSQFISLLLYSYISLLKRIFYHFDPKSSYEPLLIFYHFDRMLYTEDYVRVLILFLTSVETCIGVSLEQLG
jgi:hypothetical protein